jgi:hypothetical protein
MLVHWWLDTRDKPGLLWAFLHHFVGRATVCFEGNLGGLELELIPGAGTAETPILRRQTVRPVLDFVTFPITESSIHTLKRTLARPGLFKDCGPIIHVQIEHDGTLAFGAFDNFHRECVIANPPTPESLLQELKARGTLRDFGKAPRH